MLPVGDDQPDLFAYSDLSLLPFTNGTVLHGTVMEMDSVEIVGWMSAYALVLGKTSPPN